MAPMTELYNTLNTFNESQWKTFNNFERKDHKFNQKEQLKDEINNIAMRIVKAREAKNNMVYSIETGKMNGAWKVPEVEHMNKGLIEANRFFTCFDY